MKGTAKKKNLKLEDKPMLQLVIIFIVLFFAVLLISVLFEDNSEKFALWALTIAAFALIVTTALNLKSASYRKEHIDLLGEQIDLMKELNALTKNRNNVENLLHENQMENKE